MKKFLSGFTAGLLLFLAGAGHDDILEAAGRGGPSAFVPPAAVRSVLENGIVLYVMEDHELPLFRLTAVVRTGSAYDPEGKEGLAELTGTVMRTGGTRSYSADAVDESLDLVAGSIEVSTGMESMTIDLSVLTKDIDRGLEIFSEMLMQPVFEENKVLLAKNLKSEELKRIKDDPVKLAFRAFSSLMYRDDPRGRQATVASVRDIRREDLIAFHRRFLSPPDVMIAVSGDVRVEEAVSKLKRRFGSWKAGNERNAALPTPQRRKGGIFFLPKDIPQSIIIYGQMAPARREGNYYPFAVLDFILGSGGFQSLIVRQIRNDRGLAYSAGSFYRSKADHGIFAAYAMTKSSSTTEVLRLLRSISEGMKDVPLGESTLTWAKKSILNSFVFSFLSSSQITHQQMMIEYEGLPDDYLVKYGERIGKVSVRDLKSIAEACLVPEDAVIVVVGNDAIFGRLEAAFGEMRRIEGYGD